ncbi:hypothetical protein GmHk_12G034708 [Glycine max]|nr:hypothetical protein GmHk_12G034708 [Glycine max]
MASFSQMQSQLQSQMQSQGLALPPEPEVSPSAARVSTKGSCVDPSPTDQETGDSDKCGLYIEENPSRLVALRRVYEGSIAVHNIPLLHGQVKVGVEEVKDAEALVPVPTDEVMWDATMFGVFNPNFPLYIKHEDPSEIAHGGQCLSISVIQLWILHLTETSMRVGNSDVYGFLESQPIQRYGQSQFDSESYIKSWIGHWQMVVILPKENLVVWFCSLHNRPDNYLKGIINSALKGLDDTPQPKSKATASVIDKKEALSAATTSCTGCPPLEPKRLKTLRIQWVQYYLRLRDQT